MEKPKLEDYKDLPWELELLHKDWQEYLAEKDAEIYMLRSAGKRVIDMWETPNYKMKMKPCIDNLKQALTQETK